MYELFELSSLIAAAAEPCQVPNIVRFIILSSLSQLAWHQRPEYDSYVELTLMQFLYSRTTKPNATQSQNREYML